jgi:nucleotide-binding universal stress UspA family protein
MAYERIVVALDGSQLAERILPHVEPLAERFGSSITLLRATIPPSDVVAGDVVVGAPPVAGPLVDPTPVVHEERKEATKYLDRLTADLRRRGFKVERVVPEGPVAEQIVEHAKKVGADLVALTTHGRSGLGRLVLGSVADAVVRHAPCPVLLVRVSEAAEQPTGA